jgi:hypothetical protein
MKNNYISLKSEIYKLQIINKANKQVKKFSSRVLQDLLDIKSEYDRSKYTTIIEGSEIYLYES